MAHRQPLFAELKRRNVWRAAALYAGAAWALAQGVAQLGPPLGMPVWGTRWFVIACVIGFPCWIAFAWFYELTPHGFRRESDVPIDAPVRRANSRTLDRAITGVLAVAVALLASGYFIHPAAPAVSGKSIAVLPFENLSSDKENAYFVSGMQDLILTKLADIGDLKVISRTSTLKYKSRPENLKRIASELGVATILEGSVQKAGNQVLINVQLIDTRTDTHLWAKTYKRTLDDIFGVEGEVAGKIADALHTKLSPLQSAQLAAIPTTDKAAYDLFLHAEYQADQGDIQENTARWTAAVALYRQATAKDPKFALAYARLSRTESVLGRFGGGGGDVQQLHRQARQDVERALRLQPDLATAHVAMGYSRMLGDQDGAGALDAFAAALALRPNDVDALTGQGLAQRKLRRFDAAIGSFKKAAALDPRNYLPTYHVAVTYFVAARYAEAEPWFRRTLALHPDATHVRFEYANAIMCGSGDLGRAMAQAQGDDIALKFARVQLLTYQRKFHDAIALLESIPDEPAYFGAGGLKVEQLASIHWQAGDLAQARVLFTKALPLNRAELAGLQAADAAGIWNSIGMDEIGIGQVSKGLAAITTSEAIVANLNLHANPGRLHIANARGYAMAHRADLAVPLLAKAIAAPQAACARVRLWIDPWWDPIRTDPRFITLLTKYAKYKPATPLAQASL